MIAERLLLVLRDIQGVNGSFVTTHAGDLLLYDMPAAFANGALALTAQRVARMLSCSSANGLEAEEALLDFGQGQLFVREFVRGYLCVVCARRVNLQSLRPTARLVARAMPAELGVRQISLEARSGARP